MSCRRWWPSTRWSSRQEDKQFTAERAEYTGTNGLLDLTGNPAWRPACAKGRAIWMRVNLAREEMLVRGNAFMKLPAAELGQSAFTALGTPKQGESKAATNEFAEVFSEEYFLTPDSALFRGHVRIEHPQMNWACEEITMLSPPELGKTGRMIIAEPAVVFDVTDDQGRNFHGTGKKAVYTHRITATLTNDMMELTGNPAVLEATNIVGRNNVITLDLASHKLTAPGKYKLWGTAPASADDQLAAAEDPVEKITRRPVLNTTQPDQPAAAATNGKLLATEKLVKEYRQRRVVNGVSITVEAGEIVGLLGPNGAGKTTTFNMVVGVIKPDEGAVKFQARDITRLPMHKRARLGMGYLTQEPSIFRKLTVEQNILAILETCRLSRAERAVRLKYLLDELDMARLAKSKAYTLSGGEKRRLEITRALVTSPKLLLLDEPFSGIDPIAVYEVQKIVRRLKERGLGILITDHNVRETLEAGGPGLLDPQGRSRLRGRGRAVGQRPQSARNLPWARSSTYEAERGG